MTRVSFLKRSCSSSASLSAEFNSVQRMLAMTGKRDLAVRQAIYIGVDLHRNILHTTICAASGCRRHSCATTAECSAIAAS